MSQQKMQANETNPVVIMIIDKQKLILAPPQRETAARAERYKTPSDQF
jgi:hypothetical protein